jgi:hypothetical protein
MHTQAVDLNRHSCTAANAAAQRGIAAAAPGTLGTLPWFGAAHAPAHAAAHAQKPLRDLIGKVQLAL